MLLEVILCCSFVEQFELTDILPTAQNQEDLNQREEDERAGVIDELNADWHASRL